MGSPDTAQWDGRTYYGRPQLKPAPFIDTLVGSYVFLAGLSGAAQVLATVLDCSAVGGSEPIIRRGRLLSLLAPTVGTVCLIFDLHTPKRFYNMLRLVKATSPMSLGSWALVGFSGASMLTAAPLLVPTGSARGPLRAGCIGWPARRRFPQRWPAASSPRTRRRCFPRPVPRCGRAGAKIWRCGLPPHRSRQPHRRCASSSQADAGGGTWTMLRSRAWRSSFPPSSRQTRRSSGQAFVTHLPPLTSPAPPCRSASCSLRKCCHGRAQTVSQVAALAALAGSLVMRIGVIRAANNQPGGRTSACVLRNRATCRAVGGRRVASPAFNERIEARPDGADSGRDRAAAGRPSDSRWQRILKPTTVLA